METFVTDTPEARTPNVVDIHVGGRLRLRRKMLGVSQETLADALKLTFQQIQRYERGANRVSASKLYEIAKTLHIPVSFFFDGLADPMTNEVDGVGAAAERVVIQSWVRPRVWSWPRCFRRSAGPAFAARSSISSAPWLTTKAANRLTSPERYHRARSRSVEGRRRRRRHHYA